MSDQGGLHLFLDGSVSKPLLDGLAALSRHLEHLAKVADKTSKTDMSSALNDALSSIKEMEKYVSSSFGTLTKQLNDHFNSTGMTAEQMGEKMKSAASLVSMLGEAMGTTGDEKAERHIQLYTQALESLENTLGDSVEGQKAAEARANKLATQAMNTATALQELDAVYANETVQEWSENLDYAAVSLAEQQKHIKMTAAGFVPMNEQGRIALDLTKEQAQALRDHGQDMSLYAQRLRELEEAKARGVAGSKEQITALKEIARVQGTSDAAAKQYVKTLDNVEANITRFAMRARELGNEHLARMVEQTNRAAVAQAHHSGALEVTASRIKILNQDGFVPFNHLTKENIAQIRVFSNELKTSQGPINEWERALSAIGEKSQRNAEIIRALGQRYGENAANVDMYKRAMNDANKVIQSAEAHLIRQKDRLQEQIKNTTTASRGYRHLKEELEQVNRQLKELSQPQTQVNEAMESYNKITDKAYVSGSNWRQMIGSSVKEMTTFEKVMDKINRRIRQFGAFLVAAYVLQGFRRAIRGLIETIAEFDQALYSLMAIINVTEREAKALGETILNVARTTKFSAGEVAEGMQLLGQAGFSAVEAMQSIQAVADLATGTLEDFRDVVDLMTTAVRAFHLETVESSRAADIFANAINNSKLVIDKLATAFNYVGAAGYQAGLTLNEVAGTLMVLANNGIRASTMGTGLRRTLLQMVAPNVRLRAAIDNVGMSLDDLNPKIVGWEKALQNLAPLMWDFENNTVNMARASEFFGTRASQVVAVLTEATAQGGVLSSAIDQTREIGSAARMAGLQQEGLEVKFKNLQDRVKNVAVALGDVGLRGVIESLVDTMRVATAATESWLRAFPEAATFVGISTSILAVTTAVAALATAGSYATGVWAKFKVIFLGAIGGIAAAISGFVLIINHMMTHVQKASDRHAQLAIDAEQSARAISSWSRVFERSLKDSEEAFVDSVMRFREENEDLAKEVDDLLGKGQNIVSIMADALRETGNYEKALRTLNQAMSELEIQKQKKAIDEWADSVRVITERMNRLREAREDDVFRLDVIDPTTWFGRGEKQIEAVNQGLEAMGMELAKIAQDPRKGKDWLVEMLEHYRDELGLTEEQMEHFVQVAFDSFTVSTHEAIKKFEKEINTLPDIIKKQYDRMSALEKFTFHSGLDSVYDDYDKFREFLEVEYAGDRKRIERELNDYLIKALKDHVAESIHEHRTLIDALTRAYESISKTIVIEAKLATNEQEQIILNYQKRMIEEEAQFQKDLEEARSGDGFETVEQVEKRYELIKQLRKKEMKEEIEALQERMAMEEHTNEMNLLNTQRSVAELTNQREEAAKIQIQILKRQFAEEKRQHGDKSEYILALEEEMNQKIHILTEEYVRKGIELELERMRLRTELSDNYTDHLRQERNELEASLDSLKKYWSEVLLLSDEEIQELAAKRRLDLIEEQTQKEYQAYAELYRSLGKEQEEGFYYEVALMEKAHEERVKKGIDTTESLKILWKDYYDFLEKKSEEQIAVQEFLDRPRDTSFAKDYLADLNNLSNAVGNITNRWEEQAEMIAHLNELKKQGKEDEEETLRVHNKLLQEQMGSYSNLFGTVSQFYSEGSKQRKAFHNLEMAFGAAEIAMETKKMIHKAVTAIANQAAGGDSITAWGRVAAMTSLMAGVLAMAGVTLGGSSGGGAPPGQRAETTGTVLGAPDKGSQSVMNAFDLLNDYNDLQYVELKGIHDEMRKLSNSIEGFVLTLVRSIGTFDASDFSGIKEREDYFAQMNNVLDSAFSGMGFFGDILGGTIGAATSWALSGLSSLTGLGSSSSSLRETGLEIADFTIGELQRGIDVGVRQYALYRTKKKTWYGRTSKGWDTQHADVDSDVTNLMNQIFLDLTDSLMFFASEFGTAAHEVQNYVIEAGQLDLKDLSGEEITEKISEWVSTTADRAVSDLFGDVLAQFQKLDEGLLETATRLIRDLEVLDKTLDRLNVSFNYAGVRGYELSQEIIDLAGGLNQLVDATDRYYSAFFSSNEQIQHLWEDIESLFDYLGTSESIPQTREEFRALVESLNLATESGQRMFVELMKIADAMDKVYSGRERIDDIFEEIASYVRDITDPMSEYEQMIQSIVDDFDSWIEDLLEHGAKYEDLNRAMELFQKAIDGMADNLEDFSPFANVARSLEDLLFQLRGGSHAPGVSPQWMESQYQQRLEKALTAAPEEAERYMSDFVSFAGQYLDFMKSISPNYLVDAFRVEQDVESLLDQIQTIEQQMLEEIRSIVENTNILPEWFHEQTRAQEQQNQQRLQEYNAMMNNLPQSIWPEPFISGVSGFQFGGMHSGGLRVVGERGPELEYTGRSGIMSATDVKELPDQIGQAVASRLIPAILDSSEGRNINIHVELADDGIGKMVARRIKYNDKDLVSAIRGVSPSR